MSKKRKKNSVRSKPPVSTPVKKTDPSQPAAVPKTPPPSAISPPKKAVKKPFPAKTIAITAVMVICVAAGAWFALSPMLEKNRAMEQQNALLDSIEQGDGEIVLDAALAATAVDFYDDSGEETPQPDATATPAATESGGEPEATAPGDVTTAADTVITGIGILTIDKIDAKLPVTDGVTSAQLKVAVGHVRGTPDIGAEGNSVIAGHRSYTYGQFFNRLGEVAVGDIIRYQIKDGEVMEFSVYEILEVDPSDPATLYQPEDKNIITLLTCTPIRTATHRLLVRAELISE